MKQSISCLTAVLCLAAAGLAGCKGAAGDAGGATDGVTVSRQANFKKMGAANKALADELKKAAPSIEVARTSAPVLSQLAPQVATWFPDGSGPEAGVETEALPAIWQRRGDFDRKAQDFVDAAGRLQAAADSGDLEAIRAASTAVGAACKSCHTDFRAKK